jgi:hypothetical protein
MSRLLKLHDVRMYKTCQRQFFAKQNFRIFMQTAVTLALFLVPWSMFNIGCVCVSDSSVVTYICLTCISLFDWYTKQGVFACFTYSRKIWCYLRPEIVASTAVYPLFPCALLLIFIYCHASCRPTF